MEKDKLWGDPTLPAAPIPPSRSAVDVLSASWTGLLLSVLLSYIH